MAKSMYKIPTDLSISYLDQEIGLSNSNQAKPVQLRLLLSWLGSLFLGFWLVTQTFLRDTGPVVITLFIVWWVTATAFYCRNDETKRMRLLGLSDLPGYLRTGSRRVQVRSGSPAAGLLSIVGFREVTEPHRPGDPARIEFRDGSVGFAYQVVGSASALLFEADRMAILDRVDAFYRKIDTDSEWLFLTLKRAQRVDTQLASIAARQHQHSANPELLALLGERASVLSSEVGKDYLSVQQYLLVRAPNAELLARSHALAIMEASESQLMMRSVEPLDRERTFGLLRELYGGR